MKYSFLLLATPLFISCGPMNSTPATVTTNAGTGVMANSSTKGKYVIFSYLAKGAVPRLGDNEFMFRIVRSNDGTYLPEDVKIEAELHRVNSKTHKITKIAMTKESDGAYHATVSVKKAGDWFITLKITDSDGEDDFNYRISF